MSIISYNQLVKNGDTGALDDRYFGEFVAKIAIVGKDGKVKSQMSEYAMSGPAIGNLADLYEAASQKAGQIAALSAGVLVALFAKLGKYRDDELPEAPVYQSQWGSVILSNDPRVENPLETVGLPLETKSGKIFIPWLGETVSRQDMKETIVSAISVNAVEYDMATSRFIDSSKIDMASYQTEFIQGVSTRDYNKSLGMKKTAVDTDPGFGVDKVLGEDQTPVIPGVDD